MDTSAEQVQLYAVSLAGKLFPFEEVYISDEKSLPATADLSEETDRAHILSLQEEMIDVYVPTIILNLCAGGTVVELNMANRMLSDNNMSKLLDALRQLGPNTPGLQWREIDERDLDNANEGSSCDEEEEEEEEEKEEAEEVEEEEEAEEVEEVRSPHLHTPTSPHAAHALCYLPCTARGFQARASEDRVGLQVGVPERCEVAGGVPAGRQKCPPGHICDGEAGGARRRKASCYGEAVEKEAAWARPGGQGVEC